MALYQAYIAVSMTYVIMIIIHDILINDKPIKEIISKIVKICSVTITGGVIYVVVLKIYQHIYNVTQSGYKGFGNLTNYFPVQIIKNSKEAFEYSFEAIFTNNIFYNNNLMVVSAYILIVLLIISVVKLYSAKKNKSILTLVILGLFIIAFFYSFGIMKVLVPEVPVSPLTVVNLSFFWILPMILFEKINNILSQKLTNMKWLNITHTHIYIYMCVCDI